MNLKGLAYRDIDLNGDQSLADRWILTRLNETVEKVTRYYDLYDFGEAGRHLYTFIWDDFCDWYIEMAKLPLYGDDEKAKQTAQSVLAHVLDNTLRLLHPIMPFITEEIWQHLPHQGETIMLAAWPEVHKSEQDESNIKDMNLIQNIIKSIRNIRAEMNVAPSKQVDLRIKPASEEFQATLLENEAYLKKFCNAEHLTIDRALTPPEKVVTAVVTGADLYLPLEGLINIEEEVVRLEKGTRKIEL